MLTKGPTRILMVSEPGAYGVFFYVRQLIRFLHGAHPEITVDLAYSSRRSWPAMVALVEEVRSRGGVAIDLKIGNGPEPRDFQAVIRLWWLVWRHSPQVVHAHSSKAGGLCRLLRWLPGFPPVLYTPNAYFGMARTGGKKESFFNRVESLLGRRDFSHVVSADERRFALETLKLPVRSLVLVNNGIVADHFTPATAAARLAARDKLGLPREGKLLITVGRDSRQKNYAPLYGALNRLLAERPGIYFAHAGNGAGKRREELDAAVRGRCHAFEHLDDVRQLLWAADGFIMTSLYEGLSISMLEAISCGLPLLLTAAPGLVCIRAYGLKVDWLPDPNHGTGFEAEVLKSLVAWSGRPPGETPGQHDSARRNFNAPIQFSKIVRLYERMVRARKS